MDNQFIILYLLLAFLFWSLFVSRYLVSSTRQKLFVIRDSMFLDFKHNDDYHKLRERINLFIRFADKASWQRMLFDSVFLHKELKQAMQSCELRFSNSELNKIHFDSTFLIIRLIVLRSPLLILFVMPLSIIGIIWTEVLSIIKNKASNFVVQDASIYAAY